MITLLKNHHFFKDKHIESCTRLANQGYCNENYLVVAQGVKYIVRKLLRDDINRELEWSVLVLAYKNGITAEPLVYDIENTLMIFSFLEGKHKILLTKDDIKALAMTIKKLHTITLDKNAIDINLKNKTDKVTEALKVIEKYPREYVLCHNDLNPQNIFFSYNVRLIDFEYAGMNDKYFDLASICVEFNLDVFGQQTLVDAYFKSYYVIEKLEAYKVIYKTMVEEWFENML